LRIVAGKCVHSSPEGELECGVVAKVGELQRANDHDVSRCGITK
jgi:hypothetical protein